jgi:hypothetical protein
MEGLKVKCPKCKRTGTYITTDKYNPDIAPNGSMVKLRNSKHKGGLTFGSAKGSPNIKACFMECCDCGGLLTFGGKLIVLPEEPAEEIAPVEILEIEEPKKRVKK